MVVLTLRISRHVRHKTTTVVWPDLDQTLLGLVWRVRLAPRLALGCIGISIRWSNAVCTSINSESTSPCVHRGTDGYLIPQVHNKYTHHSLVQVKFQFEGLTVSVCRIGNYWREKSYVPSGQHRIRLSTVTKMVWLNQIWQKNLAIKFGHHNQLYSPCTRTNLKKLLAKVSK